MNREQCLKLINLYSESRALWDSHHIEYMNKTSRMNAWKNITRKMNLPTVEIRMKMVSLLGSYRRERSREKRSQRAIADPRKQYKSNWYAYNAFQFMRDKDLGIHHKREGEPNGDGTTQIQEKPQNEREERLFETKKRNTQTVPFISSTSTSSATEDEFDLFGRSMAYQLKRLPEFTALDLMQTMQEIVIKKRKEVNLNMKSSTVTSRKVNTWDADLSVNNTGHFVVSDDFDESLVEADDCSDPLQAKRIKLEIENDSSE